MKTFNRFMGYTELLLAQICTGINIVLAKALANTYPLSSLLALRFLIGFIAIVFYLQLTTALQTVYLEIKNLSKQEWIILLLQTLFGGFLYTILTLYGLQYTTANITGIVNSTCPAFIALFSLLFLKESLTKRKILAIVISILGIVILSLKNGQLNFKSTNLLGLSLVSLAVIPGALYTVLTKKITKPLSPFTPALFMNLPNALLFIPLAFKNHDWTPFLTAPMGDWLKLLLYGLTSGFLFFIFWYRSLLHISANIAGLFIGFVPISTSLLAYLFLGERITSLDIVGMLCVLMSLIIGTLPAAYWSAFKIFAKKPSASEI